MKYTQSFAFFLAVASLGYGDTLYLRDGKVLQGVFISGNSRQVRFTPDRGRTQTFLTSAVDRLEFGNTASQSSVRRSDTYSAPRYGANTAGSNTSGSYEASRSRADADSIPQGTVITVRTIDPINSDENNVGDRFRASLDQPLIVNGRTVAPRGADATVEVVRVQQSGAISGREEIALALIEINANGRRLVPETQHAEVSASSRNEESVKVIGGTAVVGAIIGAIAGGGKGAAIGAATGAGAGAAVQAIRGQRIQVPSESRLDFTLARPLRY